MTSMRDLATALSLWDGLAVALFFVGWIGYARFAKQRAEVQPSLLAAGHRIRYQWMMEVTRRDNRVLDGVVVQNLSTSPSFFASTTILIIGALLALLGTGDHAKSLVAELPFAARTSALLLDVKLVLLTGIFIYAFFRFTWSLRQYGFGVLLVASCPDRDDFAADPDGSREGFARRAGRVVGSAAETFNDGLRAYYFAFAAAAWLLSPLAFALGTVGVVWVLYQREFHSEVLSLMREQGGP
jgi:uncharacterized membrane protein